MKKLLIFLFSLLILVFISCDDNPANTDAELTTIDAIASRPGFSWFYEEMDKYVPDPSIISQIESSFDSDIHDIYMFVKPSCTCPGNHNYFPKLMKVLEEAGINDSDYLIYAMTDVANNHPYEEYLKLNEIPEFVVFKNGLPIYSIMDTVALNVLQDNEKTIEQYLLNAITK